MGLLVVTGYLTNPLAAGSMRLQQAGIPVDRLTVIDDVARGLLPY